jgi:uncharacterized alkaline shock family protein YloU
MKEKATENAEKVEKVEKNEKRKAKSMTEKGTELGLIKIHENVISSVVRKATLSVEGVTRLAGSSFVDNIAEIMGSRKISDRAIAIVINEDSVEIDVKINVLYGMTIPAVASAVQKSIIENVEGTTGMTVKQVNVVIQEVEEEPEEEDEEEEIATES